YGASAIAVQLISTVLLLLAIAPEHYWAVVLVPAWARWTAVLTPVLVPALGDGMAARMGRRHRLAAVIWALALAGASLWLAPALLVAAAIGPLIAGFWRLKLGRFKDRKSTRLNSSHVSISYAVFCLKKKKKLRLQNETADENG